MMGPPALCSKPPSASSCRSRYSTSLSPAVSGGCTGTSPGALANVINAARVAESPRRGAPPHRMRFNASPCSRSSRPSSRSLARVPPL